MKKLILSLAAVIFFAFFNQLKAQNEDEKQGGQEIIIRKSDDKNKQLIIDFNNGTVTINGKPILDYNEDGITIKGKKFSFGDKGGPITVEGFDLSDFLSQFNGDAFGNSETSRTFLGVQTEKSEKGLLIKDVVKESPAEKAGLQKDDIIKSFDGKELSESQDLYDAVTAKKSGDEIKLQIVRNGKSKKVKVILGEKKEKSRSFSFQSPNKNNILTIPKVPPTPKTFGWGEQPGMDGLLWEDRVLGRGMKPKLGLKIQDTEEGNGVQVLEVEEGSAGEKSGLKSTDIIIDIDGKAINNTDDARAAFSGVGGKANYTIKAKRNNTVQTFEIKIPKKLKTVNL